MKEKIFAEGFSFKRNENAPDFVVGRLTVKVDEAIAFLKANVKNGWVSLDVKTGRSGNHYVELDTYEPKGGFQKETKQTSVAEKNEDFPLDF